MRPTTKNYDIELTIENDVAKFTPVSAAAQKTVPWKELGVPAEDVEMRRRILTEEYPHLWIRRP